MLASGGDPQSLWGFATYLNDTSNSWSGMLFDANTATQQWTTPLQSEHAWAFSGEVRQSLLCSSGRSHERACLALVCGFSMTRSAGSDPSNFDWKRRMPEFTECPTSRFDMANLHSRRHDDCWNRDWRPNVLLHRHGGLRNKARFQLESNCLEGAQGRGAGRTMADGQCNATALVTGRVVYALEWRDSGARSPIGRCYSAVQCAGCTRTVGRTDEHCRCVARWYAPYVLLRL